MQRYKAGLVGYLDVVFAQETELSNERAAAQISGQQLVASVVLIKALGADGEGTRRHDRSSLDVKTFATLTWVLALPYLALPGSDDSADDAQAGEGFPGRCCSPSRIHPFPPYS